MDRVIVNKSIGLYIVLTIITCGIFGLFWLYTIAEDMNYLAQDGDMTSGGMVVLLSFVTCGIYGWYWLFKQGERVDKMKMANGEPTSSSGIIYLVLAIFGLSIVSYALIQSEINKRATTNQQF